MQEDQAMGQLPLINQRAGLPESPGIAAGDDPPVADTECGQVPEAECPHNPRGRVWRSARQIRKARVEV